MKTIGHSASHGGLRGHSVGEHYPFRIVGLGDYWAVCEPSGKWHFIKFRDIKRASWTMALDHLRWQEMEPEEWKEYKSAWYVDTPQETKALLSE